MKIAALDFYEKPAVDIKLTDVGFEHIDEKQSLIYNSKLRSDKLCIVDTASVLQKFLESSSYCD